MFFMLRKYDICETEKEDDSVRGQCNLQELWMGTDEGIASGST
jgi:hypothetical protein